MVTLEELWLTEKDEVWFVLVDEEMKSILVTFESFNIPSK
jgi:hypothetical protein